MKTLLCAATEIEIAATIQQTVLYKPNVEVLITGVGLMTATYALTKAVALRRPDLIIQAGIAGTFDESQILGTVVAVRSETVADLGVQEGNVFLSLFDLKLLNENNHPWTHGKLTNTNSLISSCRLPVVDGITVNEISTNKERIEHYQKTFNASVEGMEGAALHYVGLMENIPFLQLRSLSNFVGERDKAKWKMKEAIVRLNTELQRLLKSLTE